MKVWRIAAAGTGVAMVPIGVVLTQHPVDEVAIIGGGMAFCGLTIALSAIFRPRDDG